MLTITLSLIFLASGALALGSIAGALSQAIPQIKALSRDLSIAGSVQQMQYRIVEIVVTVDCRRVVALPIKPRPLAPARQDGLRAAA